jgi:CubicO group peptidase (beta-lactamase class C family)
MKFHLALLAALTAALTAFGDEESTSPQTIPELHRKIEAILTATKTPGAGIALVSREGPIWVAGVGLADVAQNRPATEDTLFRLGSTSKTFVALSVLKLQQDGLLNLQDTLRARAPEVEFANPWEATDPVRIVNLLEHTAGWDDGPQRKASGTSVSEPSRREALAAYANIRTSRWRPGTSFSYTNIGPAMAAYIVEKVAGEKFEDYVARTWFLPLGMTGASYKSGVHAPELRSRMATNYQPGGGQTTDSADIVMSPAGGLSATPRDMANYLEFFLSRGSFRGTQLLPQEAIDRMERPASSYAASDGLEIGYGLNNSTTVWGNWIFHGHGGAVHGALANMLYLPNEGGRLRADDQL